MPDLRPPPEVSLVRLYLMRLVFFLNFVFLGLLNAWPQMLGHRGPWDPLTGVAFSFWGALGILAAVGIRYPLKMVPVLMMQFLYKAIWLSVILPSGFDRPTGLTTVMATGVIADLIVIPWPYLVSAYVRPRGDRWK